MITPEQAVIAAVLLDSRVLRFAAAECTPDDFNDGRLGVIYRGITLMAGRREAIDVVTVSEKLREWECRGIEPFDLHTWIEELPTAQNVGYYAAQVRDHGTRRKLQEVAVRLNQQADQFEPGWAMSNAIQSLKEIRDGVQTVDFRAKSLAEILAVEDSFDWIIPGLMERRDRLVLTGHEGGGKTTLIRQMAIMSSAGLHPFTGGRIAPVRVLVVDAENTEKQWRRTARGMATRAAGSAEVSMNDTLQVACVSRLDLTRDKDLGKIHKLVDDWTPDLLCIGPLYRLIPRAINSDDEAAPLLAALDTLRERDAALIIEAHAGHALGAGGERDVRPRGSSALLGWPEFGLGLRPDRNEEGVFDLKRWRGDRDQRSWPHRVARDVPGGWPWTAQN